MVLQNLVCDFISIKHYSWLLSALIFVQTCIRFHPSSLHLTCCSRGVVFGLWRHVGMLTSVRGLKNSLCSLFVFSYHAKWWRLLSVTQTIPPTRNSTTGRGMDVTQQRVFTHLLTHTHLDSKGEWDIEHQAIKTERENGMSCSSSVLFY